MFSLTGNVVQPDIIYVSESRVAEIVKTRVEGAPDLVVEILSPSTAYYDLRQKKDLYQKYGVKEYIIIDPIQENAEVYILQNGAYILNQRAQKDEILNSVLINGFNADMNKLFR